MKRVALFAVATGIACSSPRGGAPDAASTPVDSIVPSDAADSPPDSRSCPPSSADADGDCVADASDVCPNVADPAQLDLDGDGIGWMCDPYETIEVPGANPPVLIRAASTADTFATLLSSSGGSAIVAVSPLGKLFIPPFSTNPADMWTLDFQLSGPIIDAEGNIWWSHGPTGFGEAGIVDPVAGTFTKKQDGTFNEFNGIYADGKLGLLRISQYVASSADLFSPQHGALVRIDSRPTGEVRQLASAPQPTFIYATSSAIPGKFALRRYVVGAPTATDLMLGSTVLNNLDEAANFSALVVNYASGQVLGELSEMPFCIRQGASVRYVGVTASGVNAGVLPFSGQASSSYQSCNAKMSSLRGHTLAVTNTSYDLNADNIVTVRDGIVTLSVSNISSTGYSIDGDQLAILNGANQYVVAPDRTTATLASGLFARQVSYAGNVVHVAGVAIASPSDPTGNLVLVRYHPSTGVQTITIRTNVARNATIVLGTTAEGAAIVGQGDSSWVVPSTSTTVTPLTFSLAPSTIFTRGNQTLIAFRAPAPATSGYTIHAYDEPGGAPRFTPLTDSIDHIPTMLGQTWFDLVTTTTCQIARLTTAADGTPTLAPTMNCSEPSSNPGVSPLGTTTSGETVARTDTALYLLSPTSVTKVAQNFSSSTFQLVRDDQQPRYPVVGWVGVDAMGGFACLASHPERCWTIPAQAADYTFGESSSSPDGSLAVATYTYSTPGPPIITIVRSLGTGTRPQPL